jgi:putative tryptophan/tyrosine transport system substrate-binding protein
MKRREFISVLGGAVAAWPLAAHGQPSATTVIGFLSTGSLQGFAPYVVEFRKGLADTGHIEGSTLVIDFRWAEGQFDRLPELAEELVRRGVSLIVATGGSISAQAAKAATASIPIVFTSGFDPVAVGLVPSLNKPGGNVTGVSIFASQLSAKRVGILRELLPSAAIAMLINPSNPNAPLELEDAKSAEALTGQTIRVLNASSDGDLDILSADFDRKRPGALLVSADPFFVAQRKRLIEIAAKYAIPAVYGDRQIASDGGLLSYGASIADAYRQVGVYAGKILNGAKPADLPILQPTRFELVINMKTAKTLSLAIPPALLALADEVIE